jgi:hypothetical protein
MIGTRRGFQEDFIENGFRAEANAPRIERVHLGSAGVHHVTGIGRTR